MKISNKNSRRLGAIPNGEVVQIEGDESLYLVTKDGRPSRNEGVSELQIVDIWTGEVIYAEDTTMAVIVPGAFVRE